MARKATRLRFTKEELASPKVRQAAARAEKAADKADRAAEKAPKRRRLKLKTDKTAERKVHLTFEKQEIPAGELTGRGRSLCGGCRFRHRSQADCCGQPG